MAHTATTRVEAFDPLHEESPEYARNCWGIATEDDKQKPVS
jgi:putative transposase